MGSGESRQGNNISPSPSSSDIESQADAANAKPKAGILKTKQSSEYINPAYVPDGDEKGNKWNDLLHEMLTAQEELDLHPYGRGDVYKNVTEGRKTKIQFDAGKFFVWIVFIGFFFSVAAFICIVAEFYDPDPLQPYLDFLKRNATRAAKAAQEAAMSTTTLPPIITT